MYDYDDDDDEVGRGRRAWKQKKGKDRKVMGWEGGEGNGRPEKGRAKLHKYVYTACGCLLQSWLEGPDPRIPQLDTPL